MFQAAGDTLRAAEFLLGFFVLCGCVQTNTPTFWDPSQNSDKTAPNWQIFVCTKLATFLANITLYNPGSFYDLRYVKFLLSPLLVASAAKAALCAGVWAIRRRLPATRCAPHALPVPSVL